MVPAVSRVLRAALFAALAAGCAAGSATDPKQDIDPSVAPNEPKYSPDRGGPNFPEAPPEPAGGRPSAPPGASPLADGGAPGMAAEATRPGEGEILVTEVMYDPISVEPVGEWLEVQNVTSTPKTLSGLTMTDGAARTHVIGEGVVVAPGAFIVLARTKAGAAAAKIPADVAIYEYGIGVDDSSGIQLSNNATGKITLSDGARTITSASYGGWFASVGGGSSIQLKTLTVAASAQSTSWCVSKTAWATGTEKGTPGRANNCP